MTITSHHNRKLKEIRKLRQRRRWRERSGRFVAEGEDLLAAADAAGWEAVERYCVAGSGLAGTEVDAELLTTASGLVSGTRALAVYEERWAPRARGPLCVYLHGLHDPGNVGTILRSAHAFGVSSVAIGPGTADPFSPKAVRASMGAVFGVPLARTDDLDALPGIKIALVPGEGTPLHELWRIRSTPRNENANPPEGALTLLVGSEREGLPPGLIDAADLTAHIAIETDSLNAAMAATIALYELRSRMARP
jgi:TrmH family RNA methyltransferase